MNTPAELELNDDRAIPQLGFGVWQIPQNETADLVATAVGKGYRLIDGAYIYGNEAEMGEGIRHSGVERDEIFVTSKVWNEDQGHDSARRAVERSVDQIGVGPLDLMLIHWPCPARAQYVETWKALIEARDAGLVRSIGVSNFHAEHLDRIIDETGVSPVLNQIELHPRLPQDEMRRANAERGIVTQSWTPLGRANAFDAPEIRTICERTGKSPAQLILRWHMQLGVSAIPRSTKPNHIASNFGIFDFELTQDDMAAVARLATGERIGSDPADMN